APPKGLKSSNVLAVGPDGKVQALTDREELGNFVKKELAPCRTDDQRKDAARAWLRLAQELHQDGFYRFDLMDDSTRVEATKEGRRPTPGSGARAGGTGPFDPIVALNEAGGVNKLEGSPATPRGPRPRCQAPLLLPADPIVRGMAEQDLLYLGRLAKP